MKAEDTQTEPGDAPSSGPDGFSHAEPGDTAEANAGADAGDTADADAADDDAADAAADDLDLDLVDMPHRWEDPAVLVAEIEKHVRESHGLEPDKALLREVAAFIRSTFGAPEPIV